MDISQLPILEKITEPNQPYWDEPVYKMLRPRPIAYALAKLLRKVKIPTLTAIIEYKHWKLNW